LTESGVLAGDRSATVSAFLQTVYAGYLSTAAAHIFFPFPKCKPTQSLTFTNFDSLKHLLVFSAILQKIILGAYVHLMATYHSLSDFGFVIYRLDYLIKSKSR